MTGMSGTMRGGGGGREAERGGEGEAGAGQEATFTIWTARFNFTDKTINIFSCFQVKKQREEQEEEGEPELEGES